MSLLDAVIGNGPLPPDSVSQAAKKRQSELLSDKLAAEVAAGLRAVGFPGVRPAPGGPGEREFQGGLGPKKVDVSYADEQNGLMLAVSIKSINFAPFGKNLKNRFSDLCTEAISLHMRFPYAVVCALFAFPSGADRDVTPSRPASTFQRAVKLFGTVSGRREYTDPGEKFENVTLMLYEAPADGGVVPSVRLVNADTQRELTEQDYYQLLRDLYNTRNPQAAIGEQ